MNDVWSVSHRADPRALPLADRHYNRQKPGTPQFVPPGRCIVLLAPWFGEANALWVSSWPKYAQHDWEGAWVCTCFRNEGPGLSSDLIRKAVTVTALLWHDPPEQGFVTFVDASKVRKKRDPGRCYRRAGWRHVGFTKGGLWAFQLPPDDIAAAGQPRKE